MSFRNLGDIVDAENNGQYYYTIVRKQPSASPTINVWHDLTPSPGSPSPFYYASTPLEAVQMKRSVQGGINHGSPVYPAQKVLKSICSFGGTTAWSNVVFYVCDYLMYYPFFDENDIDPQVMVNNVSLPRYTDGKGVMILPVSVGSRTGGQTYQVTYTNQDGAGGRLSKITYQNNSAAINSIMASSTGSSTNFANPFVDLQAGDTGVRSIESVQMISGSDTGLMTFVLVKPLATHFMLESLSPNETDFAIMQGGKMPVILDDAYIGLICQSNQGYTAVNGYHEFKFLYN